jgi:hypothetical protein
MTPAWMMPLVGAFLALFIDLAWYKSRQSFAIRESALVGGPDGRWKAIAAVFRTWDLVGTVFMGLVTCAGIAFVLYVEWPSNSGGATRLTSPFVTLQLGVVSYVLLRWLVVRLFVGRGLGKNQLPTYELDDDGITIDLRWSSFPKGRRSTVQLRFEEINDLRDMTFSEAQAFIQGEVGPNAGLKGRQAVDMYKYAAGKISRPDVYIQYQSGGTTLFLRGSKIFYLITVGNTENERLFATFAQKKLHTSS